MTGHDCATVHDADCQACAEHDATCGTRCDRCNDRMCAWFGPEPRACGTTCGDCPCTCSSCFGHRDDLRAELLRQLEKDANR